MYHTNFSKTDNGKIKDPVEKMLDQVMIPYQALYERAEFDCDKKIGKRAMEAIQEAKNRYQKGKESNDRISIQIGTLI